MSATVLYKYKDLFGDGIDHVEAMLCENKVWFSSPLDFNDPFDCRCVYEIGMSREEILRRKASFLSKRKGFTLSDAFAAADAKIPKSSEGIDQWQRAQIAGHNKRAENSGIFCLTSMHNNFNMWTHYARNHSGVCIQFRIQDEKTDAHIDFISNAFPVEYSDRCPQINFIRDDILEITRKAFLTKSTAFSHENEYRIVRYNEGSGLKTIPEGIIGAVILGCNVDSTAQLRVVLACRKYDAVMPIFKAELEPQTFGLRFIPLESRTVQPPMQSARYRTQAGK
ncbi:MAG: DUF2971 domain-containing protein [Planctomycetaceae bacterium]